MRAELYIGPIHASQELEDHRRQDVGAATNAYSTRAPARQPISQKKARADRGQRMPARSSENSKANRIETSERPGGISRICSMEVVKNSEENSENKRCYANTSYDPAQGCC